jgi:hypothetical protein
LISRDFDLGVGGKRDRKGVARIGVFVPALRSGRSAGNKRCQIEAITRIFGFLFVA